MQFITFSEKYFGNLNDTNNINYNLLLEKKEKNSLYIKATINKTFPEEIYENKFELSELKKNNTFNIYYLILFLLSI